MSRPTLQEIQGLIHIEMERLAVYNEVGLTLGWEGFVYKDSYFHRKQNELRYSFCMYTQILRQYTKVKGNEVTGCSTWRGSGKRGKQSILTRVIEYIRNERSGKY